MSEDLSKLSVILDRFRQTQTQQTQKKRESEDHESNKSKKSKKNLPVVQAEGLAPLPQPEQVNDEQTSSDLKWPVEPVYLDAQTTKKFKDMKLSDETVEKLKELGFTEAFSIQVKMIERVLEHQNKLSPDPLPTMLVNSFTGSGKTLAYLIPILEVIRTQKFNKPRALIIVPSKVLISQIKQIADKLTSGTNIRVQALQSGKPLAKEMELLNTEKPDIIITAPGRLTEHVNHNPEIFLSLKFIVVDEADRLVGQSFYNWTSILQVICPSPNHPLFTTQWYRPPQKLIFSATLTKDPSKLNDLQVTNSPVLPELYIVGTTTDEFVLPNTLYEQVIHVNGVMEKPIALTNHLLSSKGHTLVFTRSNEATVRLAKLVEILAPNMFNQRLNIYHYLREMGQAQRNRIVKEFQQQGNAVLVCTEVMARGVDLEVDHVINYDMTLGPREFVHRVGRTARAGENGNAYTFLAPGHETKLYEDIQQSITRFNEVETSNYDQPFDQEKYDQCLAEFGDLLHS